MLIMVCYALIKQKIRFVIDLIGFFFVAAANKIVYQVST